MALRAKHVFLGLTGLAMTVCGVRAQVRETNLRRPLTPVVAAGEATAPQNTLEDELHQMAEQAGVIFAGQVVGVHPQAGLGMGASWVEVEFHVEQAVRGCVYQQTYKLREWAGLWAGGVQRYRVGERLLMLLHTPGASGLSSPVGGQDGAIPIHGTGAAPKPEDEFVGSGDQAVDLRWLETRVVRTPAHGGRLHAHPVKPIEPVYVGREREPMVTRKVVAPVSDALVAEDFNVNPPTSSSTALVEGATLRGVLAMLGAWNAAR